MATRHKASYDPAGTITICGGQILDSNQSEQRTRRNFEAYALDINSYTWKRLASRDWREFSIRQEKGAFVLDHKPEPKTLLPGGIEYISVPPGTNEDARFLVAEVPVSLTIRVMHIELIVEGGLPEPLLDQLVEEIRANAEAAVKRRCILKEI